MSDKPRDLILIRRAKSFAGGVSGPVGHGQGCLAQGEAELGGSGGSQ